MSRQNVIRRLQVLHNLELFNILWLPVCLYIALASRNVQHWQPYAYGMFLICVVLAQGVFYWHLKLQTISKTGIGFPDYFYPLFSFFKWADISLMLFYPILIISSRVTHLIIFQSSIWSNLLFLFAVLEYTNYYYYQLSHDNMNDLHYLIKYKKFRRSPLFMDMLRSKKRNQVPATG